MHKLFCWGVTLILAAAISPTSANLIKNFGSCTTPDSESGICIALHNCEFIQNIYDEFLFHSSNFAKSRIQFLRQSQCASENSVIFVCCSYRHMLAQPTKSSNESYEGLPEPGICGRTDSTRILGGSTTEIAEHPWMALIVYEENGQITFQCGGSLINKRHVLTAAHCVELYIPKRVRLGEWNLLTNPDCIYTGRKKFCTDSYVEIPVEKTYSYPKYDKNSINQYSDIALIRLEREIAYTEFIQPLCLPITDSLKRDNFEGVVMDVVGWGATDNDKRSNKLLKAEIPIISLENCRKIYESNLRIHKRKLQNSQICAGGEKGIDSCFGDSGGPLIGLSNSEEALPYYFIAGIVSSGPHYCGQAGRPGIYVRVSDYIDWIRENIKP